MRIVIPLIFINSVCLVLIDNNTNNLLTLLFSIAGLFSIIIVYLHHFQLLNWMEKPMVQKAKKFFLILGYSFLILLIPNSIIVGMCYFVIQIYFVNYLIETEEEVVLFVKNNVTYNKLKDNEHVSFNLRQKIKYPKVDTESELLFMQNELLIQENMTVKRALESQIREKEEEILTIREHIKANSSYKSKKILEQFQNKIQELEGERTSLKLEITSQGNILESEKRQKIYLELEQERLTYYLGKKFREIQDLKNKQSRIEFEKLEYRKCIDDLQNEINNIKKIKEEEENDFNLKLRSIRDEYSTNQGKLEHLKLKNKEYQGNIIDLRVVIKSMIEKQSKLPELEESKQKLAELESTLQKMKISEDELVRQLQMLEQKNDKIDGEFNSYREEKDNEIKILTNKMEKNQSLILQKNTEHIEKIFITEEKEREYNELQEQFESRELEINKLNITVNELGSRYTQLKDELNLKENENNLLKQEIEEYDLLLTNDDEQFASLENARIELLDKGILIEQLMKEKSTIQEQLDMRDEEIEQLQIKNRHSGKTTKKQLVEKRLEKLYPKLKIHNDFYTKFKSITPEEQIEIEEKLISLMFYPAQVSYRKNPIKVDGQTSVQEVAYNIKDQRGVGKGRIYVRNDNVLAISRNSEEQKRIINKIKSKVYV